MARSLGTLPSSEGIGVDTAEEAFGGVSTPISTAVSVGVEGIVQRRFGRGPTILPTPTLKSTIQRQ